MTFYDREGLPIHLFEWAERVEDKEYCRVALDDAGPGVLISTVWLGLDHNWSRGEPLIFETAVGTNGRWEIVNRYPSLEAAREGHAAVLDSVKSAMVN